MDMATINFEVYEDSVNFLGIASVNLPNLSWLTASINGAGIAGNVEVPIIGHTDAMTTTLNFRNMTQEAIRLWEPRRHNLDLRIAREDEDTVSGLLDVTRLKHILVCVPKTLNGGTIAPASPGDGSIELATHYFATWINGKKMTEVDPLNYIGIVNGVDYLAEVRAALGKS